MPHITVQKGAIDCVVEGSGPSILLVHGSFGGAGGWKPLRDALGSEYRTVAPNRWGYGATKARPHAGGITMTDEAELIEAVASEVSNPVHVVGHSHGGVVALAFALRRPDLVQSLTLLDPGVQHVLSLTGNEAERRELDGHYRSYVETASRDARSAARLIIDFFDGEGTFDRLPERFRDGAADFVPRNLEEWEASYGFQPEATELAGFTPPTLIISGGKGHRLMATMTRDLARLMPAATRVVLEDSRHMMQVTHPEEISTHIKRLVGSGSR